MVFYIKIRLSDFQISVSFTFSFREADLSLLLAHWPSSSSYTTRFASSNFLDTRSSVIHYTYTIQLTVWALITVNS